MARGRQGRPRSASTHCLLVVHLYTTAAASSLVSHYYRLLLLGLTRCPITVCFAHSAPVCHCRRLLPGQTLRPLTVRSICTCTLLPRCRRLLPPPDAASPDCFLIVHLYTTAAAASSSRRLTRRPLELSQLKGFPFEPWNDLCYPTMVLTLSRNMNEFKALGQGGRGGRHVRCGVGADEKQRLGPSWGGIFNIKQ